MSDRTYSPIRATDSWGVRRSAVQHHRAQRRTTRLVYHRSDRRRDAGALAAYSGSIAASASDPDAGDTLVFTKTEGPEWLVVVEDGSLSGTPAMWSQTFTVRVTDLAGELMKRVQHHWCSTQRPPEFTVDPIAGADAPKTPYTGPSSSAAIDADDTRGHESRTPAGSTDARFPAPEWRVNTSPAGYPCVAEGRHHGAT